MSLSVNITESIVNKVNIVNIVNECLFVFKEIEYQILDMFFEFQISKYMKTLNVIHI